MPSVALGAGQSIPPFIVATRYPGGRAILLTALGRTQLSGWVEPAANVTVSVPRMDSGPGLPVVGILGTFATVTLAFDATCFEQGAQTIFTVLACMLNRQRFVVLPATALWVDGRKLVLQGTALKTRGTAARSRPDDVSAPGVVLSFMQL